MCKCGRCATAADFLELRLENGNDAIVEDIETVFVHDLGNEEEGGDIAFAACDRTRKVTQHSAEEDEAVDTLTNFLGKVEKGLGWHVRSSGGSKATMAEVVEDRKLGYRGESREEDRH